MLIALTLQRQPFSHKVLQDLAKSTRRGRYSFLPLAWCLIGRRSMVLLAQNKSVDFPPFAAQIVTHGFIDFYS